MANLVKIGLIQMRYRGSEEANLAQTMLNIRNAASKGAQIICLQELFRSDYFCQEEVLEPFELAEAIPGPSTELLGGISKELGTVIIASLFEKRAAGIYHNTAVVLGTDGNRAVSVKSKPRL